MTYTITCAAYEQSTLYLDCDTNLSELILIVEQDAHCSVIITGNCSITMKLIIHLIGERATCTTQIALLLKDSAQAVITTEQIHTAFETQSTVLIKSVLYDSAHLEYTGTITIKENASQSNAQQNSYALLLSPHAQAYAHPALEVLTHDVQCGHGAAVSSLDFEHLFYVQSRGLGKERSEKLIVDSFLSLPL